MCPLEIKHIYTVTVLYHQLRIEERFIQSNLIDYKTM